MSTLYLVRHGQASFSADRYDQLSALGYQQAAATGLHLATRGIRFDRVYVGPRLRHRQTAEAALQSFAETPALELADGLDEFADGEQILASAERHFGVSLHSDPPLRHDERLLHYANMVGAWAEGLGEIDGRPSAQDFRAGVAGWLRQAQASAGKGEQALVFTSAGTIAIVLCEILSLPTPMMATLASVMSNGSITEIVHTPQKIALRCFNVCTHLPTELTTTM